MNESVNIRANLALVREQIAQACSKAGRNVDEITLVAVSKTRPAEDVLAALEAGVVHLGENRVEEAVLKIPQVEQSAPVKPIWHMIGHVQSRKARDLIPLFQMVESVDRLKLAEKLSHLAVEHQIRQAVLLEINISGEDAKHGFNAHQWQQDERVRGQLLHELEAVMRLPGLDVRGLMTMAPYYDEMDATRPVFSALYELREALRSELGLQLPVLSMGMTNDYPVAIEEGATMVRIGRAIFGERN